MHTCPMVTGIVPHVGGPIITGLPTVLTGKLPQARVTDKAVCVGPPDIIVRGSPTVLVGSLPAARLGDNTAHGGIIVLGWPTVIIGEGGASSSSSTAWSLTRGTEARRLQDGKPGGRPDGPTAPSPKPPSTFGSAITIEGSDDFKRKVLKDLADIKKTPSGAAMFKDLEASGKTVTIKETANGNSCSLSANGQRKADGTPGPGANSTVSYNPDKHQLGSATQGWQNRPAAIGLGHELIHATHQAKGEDDGDAVVQNDSKPDPSDPTKFATEAKEEVRTVGIDPFGNEPYSENKLRNEWEPQQPPRPYY